MCNVIAKYYIASRGFSATAEFLVLTNLRCELYADCRRRTVATVEWADSRATGGRNAFTEPWPRWVDGTDICRQSTEERARWRTHQNPQRVWEAKWRCSATGQSQGGTDEREGRTGCSDHGLWTRKSSTERGNYLGLHFKKGFIFARSGFMANIVSVVTSTILLRYEATTKNWHVNFLDSS